MGEPKHCPKCQAELPGDAPEGLCPNCLLEGGFETGAMTQEAPTGPPGSPQGSPSRPAFVPPEPAEIAEHFPQLEVLELLGQGGMGAVYKARQPTLDRLVALKILRPSFEADPAFAERFAREARSLARLNHPNIVGVYDFGQAGGFYYFLMEYVDGVNLREMAGRKPLAPKEALAIVPQICDALQFAHDEGIVHRDIKPENILIDKKGRVKIADFGLAKLLARGPTDVTLTQPQQVMGTPHYMAPEQVEHPADVDQRADIYSLGVVFYEMLTGELPIGRFAPPSKKVEIDVRLDEVVLKTLEKEPERRYQQVSEVKTDVESIATGPPVAAPPPAGQAPPAAPPMAGQADAPRPADVEAARRQVRGPATGLLVVGILNCLAIVLLILPIFFYHFFEGTPEAPGDLSAPSVVPVRGQRLSGSTFVPSGARSRGSSELTLAPVAIMVPRYGRSLLMVFFILVLVMYIPITVFIILGAMKMRKLESYGLAMVGSIAAMLPCTPLFLIGLAIGIWALVVLARPEVKAAFAHKPGRRGGRHDPVQKQAGETDTDEETEQVSEAAKSKIGIISLILAIGGALVTLVILWSDGEPLSSLCLFLFIALEIAALVTGIIGRRSACGKAGLIISAIMLVLVGIVALLVQAPRLVSRGEESMALPGVEVTPQARASEGPGGEVTRTYGSNNWEGLITKTGVEIDRAISNTPGGTSLKVVADSDSPTVVRLFETGPITDMFKAGMFDVDNSRLIYGTNLRVWRLEGKAYLEMRCHFPDGKESVSRSLDEAVSGTRDWTGIETSFVLKGDKEPDNVKLNLVIDPPSSPRDSGVARAKGTVWIGGVSFTLQHPADTHGGPRSIMMDEAPADLRPKAAIITPIPPVTPPKPKPATKPATKAATQPAPTTKAVSRVR